MLFIKVNTGLTSNLLGCTYTTGRKETRNAFIGRPEQDKGIREKHQFTGKPVIQSM